MLNNKYILVSKVSEEKKEGFQVVAVEDASIYQGIVFDLPEIPVYIGNHELVRGDTVIFAKYSPNTHLIQRDGQELKYIAVEDLLEVCESHVQM